MCRCAGYDFIEAFLSRTGYSKHAFYAFAKAQFWNRCYFVKAQRPKQTPFCQSTTADLLNKDMLQNLSRTGYASLALGQEQGIILKLFLVRNRVRLLGSQWHIWGILPLPPIPREFPIHLLWFLWRLFPNQNGDGNCAMVYWLYMAMGPCSGYGFKH